MDLSNFKTHDWLMIGGGVGMFVFGFFEWVTISVAGFGVTVDANANVFDFFWTGTIPWLLVIGTAVVAALLVLGVLQRELAPWPLIMLAATGLATLLMLFRVVFNPIDGADEVGLDVGRGIGMIVSALATFVALAGAFLNFQASGGDLKDLTDVDKLKSSFSSGASSTDGRDEMPPPPPPPPPPAPPAS